MTSSQSFIPDKHQTHFSAALSLFVLLETDGGPDRGSIRSSRTKAPLRVSILAVEGIKYGYGTPPPHLQPAMIPPHEGNHAYASSGLEVTD